MKSILLFRVFEIEVRMHLTFPLIFVWAALNFGFLNEQGWDGAAFGLIVTVALFLIVLLHELGHSLAAQRFGHVGVERIVLLPIGGVVQMDDLPEEPGEEFLISGSGPFVNLIIAGLMSAGALLAGQSLDIGQWFQDTSYLGQLQFWAIFRYIFLTNIFIGAFNLLPAFPMDGGRLLRSVLARRMDFVRATRIAASVGQSLAWGLGFVGFLSGNFLLILVAIFIYAGAAQEQKETEISQVLGKLRVSDIYSRDVATLSPQSTIDEAVNITLQSLQANFPICDQDKLVGIVTYPILVKSLRERGAKVPLSQIMNQQPTRVSPDLPASEIHKKLKEGEMDALLVTRDDRLMGMVTARDIAEAYRIASVNPSMFKDNE